MALEELTPSGETGATARDKINLSIQRINEFETFPVPPTTDGDYELSVNGTTLVWTEALPDHPTDNGEYALKVDTGSASWEKSVPAPPTADGEYTLKVEGGVLTWIEVSSSESKLLTGE